MANKLEVEMNVVDILSVSPLEDDHDSLRRMFECPEWAIYTDCRWRLHKSATIESALATLERSRIPVLICARSLPPGTWVDLLEQVDRLPEAPSLIVSSRSADSRLWAEVLNRGAFDLLAKPFDATEVVRAVSSAWLHWQDRQSRLATAAMAIPDAG
ncbi:MAG: response regulator [Bryobacteraceae bacterium]